MEGKPLISYEVVQFPPPAYCEILRKDEPDITIQPKEEQKPTLLLVAFFLTTLTLVCSPCIGLGTMFLIARAYDRWNTKRGRYYGIFAFCHPCSYNVNHILAWFGVLLGVLQIAVVCTVLVFWVPLMRLRSGQIA